MNKAVFIDKDGTLIQDIPYNVNPSLITLMPLALPGLQRLQAAKYLLIVVSNQAGVAKGYFPEAAIGPVAQKVIELLAAGKVNLHDFYYCPHHPDGVLPRYALPCHCRKPMPGLLLRAAKDWKIDLSASWMIGDILDDMEAGRRAGCHTILLDNGNETEWELGPLRTPDFKVKDLRQAAHIILSEKSVYADNF